MASQTEVAVHLDLSQSAVSQMVTGGILPAPAGRGGLDLAACRLAYVRHLREVAAGRQPAAPGDGLDIIGERARLTKEQADSLAMKNDLARGQVVLVADAARIVGESCAAVRTSLLALPSNLAPKLARVSRPVEIQALLATAVHDALEHLVEGALAGGGAP